MLKFNQYLKEVYNDICPECLQDPCVCGGNHIQEEQIDEVSTKTLQSYRQQSHSQIQHYKFGSGKDKPEASKVLAKREPGMAKATDKVIKKDKERIAAQPKPTPQKTEPYKPLGGRDEKSGRSYSEETEMGDAAHAKTMKHRVLVTYSDPYHSAVSMRKTKVQKHLLVPSSHKGESVYKAEAEELAKKYMKKQGYRVHEVEHVGLVTKKVNEEVEQIDELSNEKLDQYKKAAGEDASKQDKAGNFEKGHKRFKGIVRATFKQFANDSKK